MDLLKILQKIPVGTTFWSPIFTDMWFEGLIFDEDEEDCDDITSDNHYPIKMRSVNGIIESFTREGKFVEHPDGECMIFPSRENRDWVAYAKSIEPDIEF